MSSSRREVIFAQVAAAVFVLGGCLPPTASARNAQGDVDMTYLGCYYPRANVQWNLGRSNGPQSCARRCADLKYPYVGLSHTFCYCGFELGGVVDEKACATACPADNSTICGRGPPYRLSSTYRLDDDEVTSCFYYGVGFDCPPLDTVDGADSALECQRACKERTEERCFFFSYFKAGGRCLLYPNDAWYAPRRTWSPDVVSGPSTCGCYEVGVVYGYGHELRRFTAVPTVSGCQQKCQETPGCDYFTYDARRDWCHAYGSGGGAGWRRDVAPYHFSGLRSCVGCFDTGKAYEGEVGKLASYAPVMSATLCQMHCARIPDCAHFNYFPQEKSCELRKDKTEEQVWNPDAVSGPFKCNTCPCTDW